MILKKNIKQDKIKNNFNIINIHYLNKKGILFYYENKEKK